MSIYAISDLHLSFNDNKPMDIFGDIWINHTDKIKENWESIITDEDLVIIPGDLSWATYLENTFDDFMYLSNMPGKKIILKGNHDYWWTTIKKMNTYLNEKGIKNIEFLLNNSFFYNDWIICGTRGWGITGDKSDNTIFKREKIRLELSLESGIQNYGKDKNILVAMHYPPFNSKEELNFTEIMKKYNVKKCIYGHLHGVGHRDIVEGYIDEIEYNMVSCDYTNLKLKKIV